MKMKQTFILFLTSFLIVTGNIFCQEQIQEEEIKEQPKKTEEKKSEVKPPESPKKSEGQEQINESEIKDEGGKEVPENLRYYKEAYKEVYDLSFETIWQAIKKSLEDIGCMISQEKYSQTDQGLYKGSLKSDFCVFTAGKDSTFKTLKKYSFELPVIRGGIWLNGRMQYKFKLEETPDNKVKLDLKGELSGFEDFVTHEVIFWKSNGYFEAKMLDRIKENALKISKK